MKTDIVKLPQGIKLETVVIPGGTFLMGSSEVAHEGPEHEVTIAPFLMGRHLVTQAQWRAVTSLPQVERELDPCSSQFKRGESEKHYYPVESISWYEAMEFCARLSAYADRTYTLPSEAQWEYACRAGTTTPFYFGDTITPELANYSEGLSRGSKGTTDVGRFPPNSFGLYDMHGNVLEWCLDHYHDSYEGAPTDGSAWVVGGYTNFRILRGGSWIHLPWYCRSASRTIEWADDGSYYIGFRVVSVPPKTFSTMTQP